MCKVFENTFRSVNIALVNEMALLCDRLGINIWEVLDAAATKPFGIMRFDPGPGVGGHCIPLDPFYLAWKAREYDFHTRFIELAGEINHGMPYFVREKVMRALNGVGQSLKGADILVLGVAYKKDIEDWRESPAIKVMELLLQRRRQDRLPRSVRRQVRRTRHAMALDTPFEGAPRAGRLRAHPDRPHRRRLRAHLLERKTGRRHPERDEKRKMPR